MTLGNPVWCSLVRLWCWKAGILILFASRFDFEVISWHVFFFKPGLKQTTRIISRKKQPGQVSTLHLREIMLFKIFESINDAKQCVRQHQSSATKHTFCTLDGIPCFSSPVTHWIMPDLKSAYFARTETVSNSEHRWLHTHPTTQWNKGILIHLHSQESDILTSLPLENDKVAAMSVNFYRPPALVSVISPELPPASFVGATCCTLLQKPQKNIILPAVLLAHGSF